MGCKIDSSRSCLQSEAFLQVHWQSWWICRQSTKSTDQEKANVTSDDGLDFRFSLKHCSFPCFSCWIYLLTQNNYNSLQILSIPLSIQLLKWSINILVHFCFSFSNVIFPSASRHCFYFKLVATPYKFPLLAWPITAFRDTILIHLGVFMKKWRVLWKRRFHSSQWCYLVF